MDETARDVLNRAARISQLETAAGLLAEESPGRRRDYRALLGAALAVLLSLYPSMSAAASTIMMIS